MPGSTNQLFLWFLDLFHIPIHTKQRKTGKDNIKGENIIDLCITEPFPKNSRYKEEAIKRTVMKDQRIITKKDRLLSRIKGNRMKRTYLKTDIYELKRDRYEQTKEKRE
jgi:hypothetical protein